MNIDLKKYLIKDYSNIILFHLSESFIKASDSYCGHRISNLSVFHKEGILGFSCENYASDYGFRGEKLIILPLKTSGQLDLLELKVPLCINSFAVENYLNFLKRESIKKHSNANKSYISFTQFRSEADLPKCNSRFLFW